MRHVDLFFPVVVAADRYHGLYSGGAWFALSHADVPYGPLEFDPTRIVFCLDGGPNGSDEEAQKFWRTPPRWAAAGETPQAAIEALLAKGII